MKILSEGVSAHAATYLGLAQKSALLQVKSALRGRGEDNARVLDFLFAQGKKLNSEKLSLLAQKMSADPFLKVKKMIKDMISRLNQEATAEAEHKGW